MKHQMFQQEWLFVLLISFCAVLAIGFIGCGGDNGDVASISITNKQGVASGLRIDEEVQLFAEAQNSEGVDITFGSPDGSSPVTMDWRSSNSSVASVAVLQTGLLVNHSIATVKGISPGEATITVEAGGITDSVEITVIAQ